MLTFLLFTVLIILLAFWIIKNKKYKILSTLAIIVIIAGATLILFNNYINGRLQSSDNVDQSLNAAPDQFISYAKEWYSGSFVRGRNPQYYNYTSDCANFVSQTLLAGGIAMNDDWYCYKSFNRNKFLWDFRSAVSRNYWYDWDVAATWRLAADQYNYFSNVKNGYINGDVIIISDASKITEYAKSGGIRAGDLIYFVNLDETDPHHAAIVSKVDDKEIYYTGHTMSRFNRKLSVSMKWLKVYIVRIGNND